MSTWICSIILLSLIFLYFHGKHMKYYITGWLIANVLVSWPAGLPPCFIRSMRTGPRHWRAWGHREVTWSFTKVFFKFPKCFVSRLFQFFSCYGFLRDICDESFVRYLWVFSASYMIKRFVVVFIVTDIMCRHSPSVSRFVLKSKLDSPLLLIFNAFSKGLLIKNHYE